MKQIGLLEKLNPREIWADEARDFTPWLKENIQALSEALGLDLEITESEGAVGDFYVDLVGRDFGSREVFEHITVEPSRFNGLILQPWRITIYLGQVFILEYHSEEGLG